MGENRIRVGLISELPTPYRWPVFERLLGLPDLDLEILYCARTQGDRDWTFKFDPDHRVRFLPVSTLSITGKRTIHYHVNPTIFGELRRGGYDVVVLPGYAMFASQAAALWCRLSRTPYVMFSETTPTERRPALLSGIKRGILPLLVGGASAWLATGKLSKEYLSGYGADPERIFGFPNVPDVTAFIEAAGAGAGERDRIRAELGAGEKPVVLFVGRLLGVKRCDLLIRALGDLSDRGVPAALWVAGDGVERGALEGLAAELGLSDVRFLGNVSTARLPSLYASADVFVLPSDHEPWGAVVCEAMACSLPVVASDRVGAGPDFVDAGNGAVFPHGDVTALARDLERILADPAARRKMGGVSVERISRWTHEECARSFCRRSAPHGPTRLFSPG